MNRALQSSVLLLALISVDALATTHSLGIVPPDDGGSVANDMNAAGQVAGVLEDKKGGKHGVFFDNGQLVPLGIVAGAESEASRINDRGEVIGSAEQQDGTWSAFLYSRAHGLRVLGTLGGANSRGMALNNAGAAVGYADLANGEWHAFLSYQGQALQDLGTFGGKVSYANGINSLGQVVGAATTKDGFRHAFLYDPNRGLSDLGTLGGRTSVATAINDKGLVVGSSEMPDRTWHAFAYDGSRMVDLGALIGHGDSFASGINNVGQVVGTVQLRNQRYGDRRVSFIWRDGKMTLHPSGKALYLTNAINNMGVVIGATYHRGFDAATMQSNTAPFVDRGGDKIQLFFLLVFLLTSVLVIFRKRYTGLFFGNAGSC